MSFIKVILAFNPSIKTKKGQSDVDFCESKSTTKEHTQNNPIYFASADRQVHYAYWTI